MNKKTARLIGTILAIVVIIVAIIIILLHLLRGNTITTNSEIESFSNDSISCTSDQITYPFFTNNGAKTQTTKVDLIFTNDELHTIALNYILYYDDENTVITSEATNHANMNHSFYDNHLGSDAFNAKYTKMNNGLRFSLYAHNSDINRISAKYFLIKSADDQTTPTNLADYQKMYEDQGMVCTKFE